MYDETSTILENSDYADEIFYDAQKNFEDSFFDSLEMEMYFVTLEQTMGLIKEMTDTFYSQNKELRSAAQKATIALQNLLDKYEADLEEF